MEGADMAGETFSNGTYQKDGVDYTIDVRERDGAFFAAWTCSECGVSGENSGAVDTPEQAIGRAQARLFSDHHAANHPERVLTLTSIMSSSGSRKATRPRPDAKRALLSRPRDPDDPESVIDHLVGVFGIIGSPGFPMDPGDLREIVTRAVRRGHDPAGMTRQLVAIVASGDRRRLLRKIVAPTLVIHGADDPLLPVEAGRDTARHIAGAKLMVIDGMGHDLPPGAVPILVEAIAAHCHDSGNR
jgi:proline iminopeptidase